MSWVRIHPASNLPLEHRVAELEHQTAILRGVLNAAGAVTSLPGARRGETDTAAADVAVGVPVESEGSAVIGARVEAPSGSEHASAIPVSNVQPFEFRGSAMTREGFEPQRSCVDLEYGGVGADETAQYFFDAYARLYHRSHRFRYPGEARMPLPGALSVAQQDFTACLRASMESSAGPPESAAGSHQADNREALCSLRPTHAVRWGEFGSRPNVPTRSDRARQVHGVSWAGSDHLVVGYQGGHCVVYRLSSEPRRRRCGRRARVPNPTPSPKPRAVALATHGQARLGRTVHAERPVVAGYSAGKGGGAKGPVVFASGGLDNRVEVWRVGDGGAELRCSLASHVGYISALAFLPGGDRLVSASGDGMALLWDVGRAAEVACFAGHEADVVDASVAAEVAGGSLVCTASYDGSVRVWDARSAECVRLFPASVSGLPRERSNAGGDRHVESCAISPDGGVALCAMSASVHTFDVSGYRRIARVGGMSGKRYGWTDAAAFLAGGKGCVVATRYKGEQARLRLFSPHDPAAYAEFQHGDRFGAEIEPGESAPQVHAAWRSGISSLEAAPDWSGRLASGCLDGSARVFDGWHYFSE